MADKDEFKDWDDLEDEEDENEDEGGFDFEFDDDLEFDEAEMEKHEKLPVFKKAMQIAELTRAVVDTFDKEKDFFHISERMIENAYILGAKIAGAEGGDIYSLRMENAVIIKINARELLASTSLCKKEKLCDADYLQLLRDEIDEFRKLFIDWVSAFDKTNDIEDDWGIKF